MKKLKYYIIVLTVCRLATFGSAEIALEGPQPLQPTIQRPPALGVNAPAEPKFEPLTLTIYLVDGSHIVGVPNITSVPVQSPYAKMDVPLKQIRGIKMEADYETALFEFQNGDKLKGALNINAVQLGTVFGDISIPATSMDRIEVHLVSQSSGGLLLHYTFDADMDREVKDKSGNTRHGAVHNMHEYIEGVVGKALRVTGKDATFGSSGGHVIFPSLDLHLSKQFTIAFWVKDETIPNREGEAYISIGNATDGAISIGDFYGKLRFGIGKVTIVTPLDEKDRTRFIFCCLTYRQGVMKAYKNAELLGEEETQLNTLGTDMGLARHWWYYGGRKQTSTRFTGAFDDVRVYDRALSAAEIKQLCALDR